MARAFAELAFTDAVQNTQKKMGAEKISAMFLGSEIDRRDELGADEVAFITARDGFYQATISETGWPYVQFRGGPAGFLRALDAKTIAYANFRGNRHYISAGNLSQNDKVSLILMDYPNRRRLKIWGRANLDDDLELIEKLHVPGYKAKPDSAVVIKVEAFDWNCPAHIPQRLTIEELQPVIGALQQKIAALEETNQEMRDFLKPAGG